MSLSLLTMACEAFQKKNFWPEPRLRPEADASAIHGRLGAQVALLQSPILPVAHNDKSTTLKFKFPLTNHIPVLSRLKSSPQPSLSDTPVPPSIHPPTHLSD